jgi:hypothetical protein
MAAIEPQTVGRSVGADDGSRCIGEVSEDDGLSLRWQASDTDGTEHLWRDAWLRLFGGNSATLRQRSPAPTERVTPLIFMENGQRAEPCFDGVFQAASYLPLAASSTTRAQSSSNWLPASRMFTKRPTTRCSRSSTTFEGMSPVACS